MPTILAARAQMGTSLMFHIIFSVLGVGIPLLLCLAEGMGLWRKDPVWMALARRLTSASAIIFAIGAVSGTIVEFELGLLWPTYINYTGAVVGPLFAFEGFAFFVEAIFIGIYLYGWDRVSPKIHWLCSFPIWIAGLASAWFITTANAWMNTPAGFHFSHGQLTGIDAVQAIFNPSMPYQTVHMILACYVGSGFAMAAVYAWAILRGKRDNVNPSGDGIHSDNDETRDNVNPSGDGIHSGNDETRDNVNPSGDGIHSGNELPGRDRIGSLSSRAINRLSPEQLRKKYWRKGLLLGLAMGFIATPLQIISGDMNARFLVDAQPAKLAAMEGVFLTSSHVPLHIGGIPDPQTRQYYWAIPIPDGLSILAKWNPNAVIRGLDSFPPSDRPNPIIVHLAFDGMVFCAFFALFIALIFWILYFLHKGSPDAREEVDAREATDAINRVTTQAINHAKRHIVPEYKWLLWGIVLAGPLSFLAVELGWIVTEEGRQPWVISGFLRTKDAATTAPFLNISFLVFSIIYIILAITLIILLLRLARKPLPNFSEETQCTPTPRTR